MLGKKIAFALLLVFLCLLIYGQTLTFEFVNYDDGLYVTDNQQVLSGLSWKGVAWAFVTERAMYFHPLTWLSHMLDVELFGLRPWGHHLTSFALHAVNSIFLFLTLARMTGSLWPSALAGALFLVHPMHVESVAWVSERKDMLSTFFWIGAMYTHTRHRQGGGRWWNVGTVLAFVLGIMSKPMVVTLPFALWLLDFWPLKQVDFALPTRELVKRGARLLLDKWPILLLTLVMCAVTMIMQARGNNLSFGDKVPFIHRCANAAVVYVIYLYKTVWPVDLAPYYPHPLTRPALHVAGALCVLLVISALALWQFRRRPYLLMGWCWYLGTLLPVIELVQAGSFSHADRYVYIPHIGLLMAMAWGVAEFFARWRVVGTAVAYAAVAALTVCARVQAGHWADSASLFRHSLAVTGENPVALNNLGAGLSRKGKPAEAIPLYERALELQPFYPRALDNIGVALLAQGKLDEALAKSRAALEQDPKFVNAHVTVGRILAKKGDVDGAKKSFEEALRLAPETVSAHANLGEMWLDKGDLAAAAEAYSAILKINPRSVPGNLGMADVLVAQLDFPGAVRHYETSLRVWPYDAQTLYNLGHALQALGRTGEAVGRYQEALRYNPRLTQAHDNLAGIFLAAGRFDAALDHASLAIALEPGFVSAHNNFANALAGLKRNDEAKEAYLKALMIDPDYVPARLNLAQLLIDLGDADGARSQLGQVLQRDPENAGAKALQAQLSAR